MYENRTRNSIMKITSDSKLFTLKTLRKHLGLSQAELATALGVRRASISDWERGIYRPSLTIEQMQILDRLLQRAGLTIHDLSPDVSDRT